VRRSERFDGSRDPFEGDRALTLQSVPEGARVTSATLTLTPVAPPGRDLFQEVIQFTGEHGTWAATLAHGPGPPQWTEIDFHNRRTLRRFEGSNLTNAELQIDLGGVYVEINDHGAVKVDDDDPLELPSDGVVPGLTANKVKLTRAAGPIGIARVTISSAPSNLQLRLGAGPPFYARPGELARADTTPDFAVALNEALATSDVVAGFHRVPLVVHSDTIARVDVQFDVDYVLEQSAVPGGLTESTITYDHASTPRAGSALRANSICCLYVSDTDFNKSTLSINDAKLRDKERKTLTISSMFKLRCFIPIEYPESILIAPFEHHRHQVPPMNLIFPNPSCALLM